MKRCAILTIFILILLYLGKEVQGSRSISFKGAKIRYSPKYFSSFNISTADGGIYMDMMVEKPLKAGFKANVEFQLRLMNSKQHQKLFAYTLDVCSLVISFKDTIFKKWFQSLLKYGNFMQNCPVSKGHYYLNGWKLESSLIPSYLYPGDYRLKGYGFMGRYKTKGEDFIVEIEVDAIIT